MQRFMMDYLDRWQRDMRLISIAVGVLAITFAAWLFFG
jgi:hypothetical protein